MHKTPVATLLLAALAGPAGAGGDAQVLLVSAQSTTAGHAGGSVLFLAADTYETLGKVDVGPDPIAATFAEDGRVLYVLSEGRRGGLSGPAEGSLHVVDAFARKRVASIPVGYPPVKVLLAPDATRAFAVGAGRGSDNGARSRVTVVDGSAQKAVATLEVGAGAIDAALSPDGRRLFVLHGDAKGRVPAALTVVDTKDVTVARELKLPWAPAGMTPSADGRRLYVLDRGRGGSAAERLDGRVVVVDTDTAEIAASVSLGPGPSDVALAEPGRMVVTMDDALAVLDAASLVELRRIPHGMKDCTLIPAGSGRVLVAETKGPGIVAADVEHGSATVVVPRGPGFLGKLLLATVSVTSSYAGQRIAGAHPMPAAVVTPRFPGASRVTLSADGRFLYTLPGPLDRLTVYDAASFKMLDHLAVGDAQYARLLQPTGGRFLLTVTPSQLSVVDTEKNVVTQKYPLGKGGPPAEIPGAPLVHAARATVFVPDWDALHVVSLRTGARIRTLANLPRPRFVMTSPAYDALHASQPSLGEKLDRATVLEQEGRPAEAAAVYLELAPQVPELPHLPLRVADLLAKAGQGQRAREELERWLAQSPADPDRCWQVAARTMKDGRLAEALPALRCVAAGAESPAQPPRGFVHLEIARAALAAGDRGGALEHARRAKELGDMRADRVIRQIQKAR